MSDSEVLITAQGASKKFCRSLKKSLWYGVRDICSDLNPFGNKRSLRTSRGSGNASEHELPPLRKDEFWAVNDVSFEVRRGECLGLIGRNGAGKTTLLKMLNGLIKPDAGSITMRGRVGALIALGAGFNPILSGRENIYVNAAVLGLTKRETDRQIDDIIEFADIREFINAPVQSYSSGMQVRLGFAIATALKPDVLLLDEVLAVGDAGFRAKCYSRLAKLHEKSAVILVSHDMDYIGQICDRIVYFERGVGTVYDGLIEGMRAYNDANQRSTDDPSSGARMIFPPVKNVTFSLDKEKIAYGDSLEVILTVKLERDLSQVDVGFVARNETDQPVLCWGHVAV